MSPARFHRSLPMLAAATMTALAASCATRVPPVHAPPPGNAVVFVAHDGSNGKTVHIRVGNRIALILGSSTMAGAAYWTIRGTSAPTVLRQEGPAKFLPGPSSGSCSHPGVGCGSLRALFTALTPGTAVITAHRLACGEALLCGESHRHFRLTVIVR